MNNLTTIWCNTNLARQLLKILGITYTLAILATWANLWYTMLLPAGKTEPIDETQKTSALGIKLCHNSSYHTIHLTYLNLNYCCAGTPGFSFFPFRFHQTSEIRYRSSITNRNRSIAPKPLYSSNFLSNFNLNYWPHAIFAITPQFLTYPQNFSNSFKSHISSNRSTTKHASENVKS